MQIHTQIPTHFFALLLVAFFFPSGVDWLAAVTKLLFKVPKGPYGGAPVTGLTNLLYEVKPQQNDSVL
jgi:hypothetical protein